MANGGLFGMPDFFKLDTQAQIAVMAKTVESDHRTKNEQGVRMGIIEGNDKVQTSEINRMKEDVKEIRLGQASLAKTVYIIVGIGVAVQTAVAMAAVLFLK